MALPPYLVEECGRAHRRIVAGKQTRSVYWLGKKLGFTGQEFELIGTYTPLVDQAQIMEDLEAWFAETRLPMRNLRHMIRAKE